MPTPELVCVNAVEVTSPVVVGMISTEPVTTVNETVATSVVDPPSVELSSAAAQRGANDELRNEDDVDTDERKAKSPDHSAIPDVE